MRALRGLSAGLTLAVGALAVAVLATPASAAPLGATLTLDPPSGKGGTSVTATYRVGDGTGDCHMRVTFRWDGREFDTDKSNDCTSHATFKVPRDTRFLGQHIVSASDSTTHQTALATFTVTAADADPTPTRTRTGAPTPTDTANADPIPPLDTGQSAQPSLAPAHVDAGPQVKSSGSLSAWVLVFGGALIVGGIVILVLILLRLRRGDEPDDDPAPIRDFQTQPIPVGLMTSLDDHGDSTGSGTHYRRYSQ
jgi:hypothetical protein